MRFEQLSSRVRGLRVGARTSREIDRRRVLPEFLARRPWTKRDAGTPSVTDRLEEIDVNAGV